jgi:predicted nuclease of predicted toxin-antitoxin system
MKLVVDMNLSPLWAAALASHGIDASHWCSLGPPGAADEEILGWCRDHGHALLTHDLDFGAILAASGGQGPSVIQLRTDAPDHRAMAGVVASAVRELADDLVRGALVTLEPSRRRVRLLPLSVR